MDTYSDHEECDSDITSCSIGESLYEYKDIIQNFCYENNIDFPEDDIMSCDTTCDLLNSCYEDVLDYKKQIKLYSDNPEELLRIKNERVEYWKSEMADVDEKRESFLINCTEKSTQSYYDKDNMLDIYQKLLNKSDPDNIQRRKIMLMIYDKLYSLYDDNSSFSDIDFDILTTMYEKLEEKYSDLITTMI